MKIITTSIPDLIELHPKVHQDHRGFFLESYRKNLFIDNGITCDFVQDNHARSATAGVLRGLHFQTPPFAQAKLVWVTRGSVFDVAVDIRQGSPTYGMWHGVKLSADNFIRLYIPHGFAHGYVTLEPETEFQYKVDNYYAPDNEGGICWDDPDINIAWPQTTDLVMSDKDKELPRLSNYTSPFLYEG